MPTSLNKLPRSGTNIYPNKLIVYIAKAVDECSLTRLRDDAVLKYWNISLDNIPHSCNNDIRKTSITLESEEPQNMRLNPNVPSWEGVYSTTTKLVDSKSLCTECTLFLVNTFQNLTPECVFKKIKDNPNDGWKFE